MNEWRKVAYAIFVAFAFVCVAFVAVAIKCADERTRADELEESYADVLDECRKLMAENAELRKLVEDGE